MFPSGVIKTPFLLFPPPPFFFSFLGANIGSFRQIKASPHSFPGIVFFRLASPPPRHRFCFFLVFFASQNRRLPPGLILFSILKLLSFHLSRVFASKVRLSFGPAEPLPLLPSGAVLWTSPGISDVTPFAYFLFSGRMRGFPFFENLLL